MLACLNQANTVHVKHTCVRLDWWLLSETVWEKFTAMQLHHTSSQTYNKVTTMSSKAYDTAPKQYSPRELRRIFRINKKGNGEMCYNQQDLLGRGICCLLLQ